MNCNEANSKLKEYGQEHILDIASKFGYGDDEQLMNQIEQTDFEVIELGNLAKIHSDKVFMVCHVLRYTAFFTELKRIIDSKELGQLVNISHHENIGYWHFAHSYTRGNWRNSNKTSPLILSKSCHDMDLLLWLIGKKCLNIASFGILSHMKEENFIEGIMSDRCIDCTIENNCPYSAKNIYLEEAKPIFHNTKIAVENTLIKIK